ncbi:MAG TPA: aminomethyl-transferring glycine dehydrogenase subunit GcvPA [Candidatus Limnocylindria bacterium]|nr:aminomethyl-transferring glycine dehydrogenase subunit GcvPA [Candidatus Limnocylindria bacterium]
MSYVGLSRDEEQRMLETIGVRRFEDLVSAIPDRVRLGRSLGVPGPLSEIETRRRFGGWAGDNDADHAVSFLGGGLYEHYIPSALNALAQRSEFATAYTPYQPEVAQGTLTVIFEFQSMIAELTGMEVANASLYDGATAVVESVLLARHHTGRSRIVVTGALHPHTLEVLRTYLDGRDLTVVAPRGGQSGTEDLRSALGPDVAAVVYQHPNFFGLLESPQALHAMAHEAGALAVASCDPIALALLEPPGATGADLVVGEGQCLGNPPSFGGPLLGFFACTKALVRRMPGRLAAETVDRHGRRGFVLTLQTREQHIRREKATSNICTNQGLLALRATIYLGLLGKAGLIEVAELCVRKSHHAAERASQLPGYRLAHGGAFFREFVLECPVPASAVVREGRSRGVLPGVDLGRFDAAWSRHLLVAVTEQRSAADIERWLDVLRAAKGRS